MAGAVAAGFRSDPAVAADEDSEPIVLPDEHTAAVNRRRRIVVQYDAFSQLGTDFQQWIDYRFRYADEDGSQIDSLWWDIGADPRYGCLSEQGTAGARLQRSRSVAREEHRLER